MSHRYPAGHGWVGELVVIDAPTLLEGAPQLLQAAWAEWWLTKGDSMREVAEALHQLTDGDVVVTPTGASWLGGPRVG